MPGKANAQPVALEANMADIATGAAAKAAIAMNTLLAIAEDESAPAGARVSASAKIVELAIKLGESVVLAERIESLESRAANIALSKNRRLSPWQG